MLIVYMLLHGKGWYIAYYKFNTNTVIISVILIVMVAAKTIERGYSIVSFYFRCNRKLFLRLQSTTATTPKTRRI